MRLCLRFGAYMLTSWGSCTQPLSEPWCLPLKKWKRGGEGVRKAHGGLSAASPWVPFGGQVPCHLPL